MNPFHCLHLLRNPWGHDEQDVRAARLWAADKIEYLMRVVPLCPSCGCVREHQPCNEAGSITGCFDGFHSAAMNPLAARGVATCLRASEKYGALAVSRQILEAADESTGPLPPWVHQMIGACATYVHSGVTVEEAGRIGGLVGAVVATLYPFPTDCTSKGKP